MSQKNQGQGQKVMLWMDAPRSQAAQVACCMHHAAFADSTCLKDENKPKKQASHAKRSRWCWSRQQARLSTMGAASVYRKGRRTETPQWHVRCPDLSCASPSLRCLGPPAALRWSSTLGDMAVTVVKGSVALGWKMWADCRWHEPCTNIQSAWVSKLNPVHGNTAEKCTLHLCYLKATAFPLGQKSDGHMLLLTASKKRGIRVHSQAFW